MIDIRTEQNLIDSSEEKVVRAVDMTARSPEDKLNVRNWAMQFERKYGKKMPFSSGNNRLWDGEYVDLVETAKGNVAVAVGPQEMQDGSVINETIVGSSHEVLDAGSIRKGMAVVQKSSLVMVRRVLTRPDGTNLAGYRIYTKEKSRESKMVDSFFGYHTI